MKKLSLLILCIICLSFSYKKNKQFIPPGTVQISDTLYADETEISNFSWSEYEFFIKIKYGANSKEHIATLPDTTVWREKSTYNEPYVKYYYRHPAYKNYPVVGINYEQAQAFCKWRTERVKSFLSIKKDFQHQNFEYRLPTKAEWEFLSSSTINQYGENGMDEKGRSNFNFIVAGIDTIETSKYMKDNADVTAPVKSYKKNILRLYNTIGNVAEMLNEKGISKGGSWRNTFEECWAGKELPYTKPTAWLGFRCICVFSS